jgi:hypothetical protein
MADRHRRRSRRPNGIWPPFQPGHTLSVQHGAFSEAMVSPIARRVAEALMAQASEPGSRVAYLAEPTYLGAVNALSRTEARIALVARWLEDHGGDLEADGVIRPAARLLTELEDRASRERSKLGLDPLSRARLGKDIAGQALDLARLWAQEDGEDGAGLPRAAQQPQDGAPAARRRP